MATLASTARKQMLSRPATLSLVVGPSGLTTSLVHLVRDLTDDDVDAWSDDSLQAGGEDMGFEGDEDALAGESYLEAIIHDLSGTRSFPTLLPLVDSLLSSANDWKSLRCGLASNRRDCRSQLTCKSDMGSANSHTGTAPGMHSIECRNLSEL